MGEVLPDHIRLYVGYSIRGPSSVQRKEIAGGHDGSSE